MCLSTVYGGRADPDKILVRNVQELRFAHGKVICTDIMMRETEITGTPISADLVNGVVIIDTTDTEEKI
ncbi:MAG: CooT family nickel-binding protein [Clostridiales bacterium]|nr:CooT family nickel-binding protein [Clostridiales bacterium]